MLYCSSPRPVINDVASRFDHKGQVTRPAFQRVLLTEFPFPSSRCWPTRGLRSGSYSLYSPSLPPGVDQHGAYEAGTQPHRPARQHPADTRGHWLSRRGCVGHPQPNVGLRGRGGVSPPLFGSGGGTTRVTGDGELRQRGRADAVRVTAAAEQRVRAPLTPRGAPLTPLTTPQPAQSLGHHPTRTLHPAPTHPQTPGGGQRPQRQLRTHDTAAVSGDGRRNRWRHLQGGLWTVPTPATTTAACDCETRQWHVTASGDTYRMVSELCLRPSPPPPLPVTAGLASDMWQPVATPTGWSLNCAYARHHHRCLWLRDSPVTCDSQWRHLQGGLWTVPTSATTTAACDCGTRQWHVTASGDTYRMVSELCLRPPPPPLLVTAGLASDSRPQSTGH